MFQLTLQLYSAGQWLDAMTLAFPEPEKGLDGPCVPLEWDARHTKQAPAFLHDIAPAACRMQR